MSAASAASTAKSSPPPAPAPVAPVAVPAATPPVRQLRPLSPSQIQLAEYATRHHVVTLPVGTPFEDCLKPEFWANTADRLRVCDKVDVFDAKGTFYAELLVRAVAQSRPVQGAKGGAQLIVLRHIEFDPVETRVKPIEHTVEFRGPAELWCVVRITDGAVVKSHLETREMAERHVATVAVV
jgi:hypothetical protein